MSGSGSRKPPLVADRRSAKPAPAKAKAAPKKPRRTRRTQRRRGIIGGLVYLIWRTVWWTTTRAVFAVALALAGFTAYYYAQLPPLETLLDGRARGSVTMVDRDGAVFAWRGETFGGQITAETVSPHLKNAIVATEDKRFYRHFGISPRGIASAISINLREGRGPLSGNGGSTITQQVAKLLCLGTPYDPQTWKTEAEYEADCRVSTVLRKLKEMPYSFAMEAKYGKDAVLTIYLNRAYMGAGARGFEAAAQRYFGKSAANVTPAEAAMLAGVLKAPTRYAPTGNLKRSQERAAVVIGLMEEQGYLTKAEADDARANPATLSAAARQSTGGWFADWIMQSTPDFLSSETTEDVVLRTTLDQRIQNSAEAALAYIFENKVKEGSEAQAAIVVMSADGAVRAMVGGRNTPNPGDFNRATQAVRQTGSAFKPFVYAAALELGYTYNDYVDDAPLTIDIPGSGPWSPTNYSGDYLGRITLTEALKHSANTAAVRISEAAGRDLVRKIATDFGFASNLADGPALALGVSESTLINMTGAYAGILNGGTSVKPYGLVELQLAGDDTPLMGQTGGMGERVISEAAARELTYMMYQVVESGTGTRARLDGREVAGKTGTTQEARDAWFIGFTGDYVTGVWMGYDDNHPLSGVTGGGLPAEIWHETMARVEEGQPVTPLPMVVPETPLPPPPDYGGAYDPQRDGQPYDTTLEPVPELQPPPQAVPQDAPGILQRILGGG